VKVVDSRAEFYISYTGLGSIVSILSVLVSINIPVRILSAPQSYERLVDLKRIFQISDAQLEIKYSDGVSNAEQLTDAVKFFAPYIKPKEIFARGQLLATNKPGKQLIGFVPGQDSMQYYVNELPTQFPHNRFYARDFWLKVSGLLMEAGYDIISFNTLYSLEDKIFLLNEFCDAVVGYEGGICHLAHCLDIPCIILPWQYDADGAPRNSNTVKKYQHFHIDRKTWFLDDGFDILNWTKTQLKEKITELYSEKGNNIHFTDPAPNEYLSDYEKEFIKTYLHDLDYRTSTK